MLLLLSIINVQRDIIDYNIITYGCSVTLQII